MDGEMFLMQRYFGSDEESNSLEESFVSNDSNKNDNENNILPKKKKIKSSISKIRKPNKKSIISNDSKSSESDSNKKDNEFEFLPKKKFKHSKNKKKIEGTLISNGSEILESSLNTATEICHNSVISNINEVESKIKITKSENKNLMLPKYQNENFQIIGQKKDQKGEKVKPTLPKWLSDSSVIGIDLKEQEEVVSEIQYLDDFTKDNLMEMGIKFLFPVQLAVIPWLIQTQRHYLYIRPSDLCVSAPTGSGKTLAFVIPIVQSLKDRVVCAVRAVVVLPVGELAFQVYKVFENFIRHTDLKVVLLTGQKSFKTEQNALVKQGINKILSLADIVVTTPGRILDHIHRTKGFCLQQLKYLVIDEADRMMEDIQKGWLKQIEDATYSDSHTSGCLCFSIGVKRISYIQSNACSFGHINLPLQKLLFSATLSHDPEKLHSLSLYKPKLFIAQDKSSSEKWIGKCPLPENLILEHIICNVETKPIILCHYIKQRQFKKILCFTESIERAQRLHAILEEMGFLNSKEISSNYRPVQRKIILEQFCSGKVNVLVCSDLVARGIDLEGVDCVVSYDVPPFVKTYIHRIGRTARAGKSGTAVALVTKDELPRFQKLLKSADLPLPAEVIVNAQDLKAYVDPFQNALKLANAKLRKLKSLKNRRLTSKKTQNKNRRTTNSSETL